MSNRTISISVDSRQAVKEADKLRLAFRGIAKEAGTAKAALDAATKISGFKLSANTLVKPLNDTAVSAKRVSKEITGMNSEIKALEKAAIIIQGPLGGFASRVSAIHSSVTLANGAIAAQVALFSALSAGTIALFKYGEQYQRLTNRVNAFADDISKTPDVIRKLNVAATEARSPLENLVDIFSKTQMAKRQLDISTDAAIRFSTTVAQAAALSGSTLQSQQAALYQFGQALSTNFQNAGQEIASIREQAPVLAKAIEEGINKIEGLSGTAFLSLKQLAEAGLITTAKVNEALIVQRASIEQSFGQTDATISQSLTNLNNSFAILFGELNKGTGITTGVAKAVNFLAENLGGLATTVAYLAGTGLGLYVIRMTSIAKTTVDATTAVSSLSLAKRGLTTVATGLMKTFAWFLANPLAIVFVGAASALAFLTNKVREARGEMREMSEAYKSFYANLNDAANLQSFAAREAAANSEKKNLLEKTKLLEDINRLESITEQRNSKGEVISKRSAEADAELKTAKAKLAEINALVKKTVENQPAIKIDISSLRDTARDVQKEYKTSTEKYKEALAEQTKARDAFRKAGLAEDAAIADENIKRINAALKKEADSEIAAQSKKQAKLAKQEEKFFNEQKQKREQAVAEYGTIFDSIATPEQKYEKELANLEKFFQEYETVMKRGLNPEEQETKSLKEAALKKALDDELNNAKEVAEGMKKVFENVADDIRSSFSDAFKDIFMTGKLSFSKLGQSIKSTIANVFAEMATQSIGKSVIAPLIGIAGNTLGVDASTINGVGAKFGGGNTASSSLGNLTSLLSVGRSLFSGGSLFGSATNAINSFGAANLGTANVSSSFVGPLQAGQTAGTTLTGALSGAAIGAGIGSLNLFGGKQTGSTVGGAVGGFTGSFIPIPVVGTLVGSAIGSAIGGLIGAGTPTESSEFSGTFGSKGLYSATYGSKNADIKIAKGISAQVAQLGEFLSSIGASTEGISLRGGLNTNQRGGGFFDINGKTISFDINEAESINEALVKLTKEFTDLANISDNNLSTALKNIKTEGKDVAEILSDLGFAASLDTFRFANDNLSQYEKQLIDLNESYETAIKKAHELGLAEDNITKARTEQLTQLKYDLNKSVRIQLLEYSDPASAALKQLTESFVELRRNAYATGGDLTAVEQLFAIKREEILKQSVDTQVNALQEALNKIQDFRDSLKLDRSLTAGSYLSIQQEAERQFKALSTRVSSGDATSLDDLQNVSSEYLKASLEYFGPTERYLSRLEEVYQLLDSADGLTKKTFNVDAAILDQNTQQTDLLKHILEKYSNTSTDINKLSSINPLTLLRTGESASKLSEIDPTTGLTQSLTRSLKYLASNGSFDFNGGSSFADFVSSGNTQAGKEYLALLEAYGGSGISSLRQKFGFFASGTGNSAYSGLGIVGENGPELVNFGRPAQIISNGNTSGLASLEEVPALLRQQIYENAKENARLRTEINALRGDFNTMSRNIEINARLG